jgi:hypothetical protein
VNNQDESKSVGLSQKKSGFHQEIMLVGVRGAD